MEVKSIPLFSANVTNDCRKKLTCKYYHWLSAACLKLVINQPKCVMCISRDGNYLEYAVLQSFHDLWSSNISVNTAFCVFQSSLTLEKVSVIFFCPDPDNNCLDLGSLAHFSDNNSHGGNPGGTGALVYSYCEQESQLHSTNGTGSWAYFIYQIQFLVWKSSILLCFLETSSSDVA